MVEYLAPVRERYEELRADEAELERILAAGAEKARAIASPTLAEVRAAMGVGRRPALVAVLAANLAVVDRGDDHHPAGDIAERGHREPAEQVAERERALEQRA